MKQRGHQNGQQTHKKMFNITSHQGNANQNCNKILSPHTRQNDYHLKDKGQQVLVRMW